MFQNQRYDLKRLSYKQETTLSPIKGIAATNFGPVGLAQQMSLNLADMDQEAKADRHRKRARLFRLQHQMNASTSPRMGQNQYGAKRPSVGTANVSTARSRMILPLAPSPIRQPFLPHNSAQRMNEKSSARHVGPWAKPEGANSPSQGIVQSWAKLKGTNMTPQQQMHQASHTATSNHDYSVASQQHVMSKASNPTSSAFGGDQASRQKAGGNFSQF